MPAKRKDVFSQIGYVTVTMAAINTLAFNGLSVFSNILTPKGLIIHMAEYFVGTATLQDIDTDGDQFYFGLCGDDSIAAIDQANAQVYDHHGIIRLESAGAAANFILVDTPIVKDFSTLPGGGRLLPADRIYIYAGSGGMTVVGNVTCRFHFTLKDLSAQEYIELAQSLRVMT